MSGLKIFTFLVGHRGPHEDPLRVGCGPRAGRCAPLIYVDTLIYADTRETESKAECKITTNMDNYNQSITRVITNYLIL